MMRRRAVIVAFGLWHWRCARIAAAQTGPLQQDLRKQLRGAPRRASRRGSTACSATSSST